MTRNETSDIVIYQTEDGQTRLEVSLKEESVWLNLNQMVSLFQRDKSVISRHLKNVFGAGELVRNQVVAKNATTAADGKTYQVEYFNLDAIISVGYRVNSICGTQFRVWATQVLKDHLLKGYSENAKRLKELQTSIRLVNNVIGRHDVSSEEAKSLLEVISDYSYALELLDDYDHQRLVKRPVQQGGVKEITYEEVMNAIAEIREKNADTNLFGQEKDGSLKGSLQTIFQTFGGDELYPSLEEKAVNLLYFMVKNHSFIDGNKRIAAFVFLWFLDRNEYLYTQSGSKRIADNALVAITLMIAESKPEERETIVNITVNLINQLNP